MKNICILIVALLISGSFCEAESSLPQLNDTIIVQNIPKFTSVSHRMLWVDATGNSHLLFAGNSLFGDTTNVDSYLLQFSPKNTGPVFLTASEDGFPNSYKISCAGLLPFEDNSLHAITLEGSSGIFGGGDIHIQKSGDLSGFSNTSTRSYISKNKTVISGFYITDNKRWIMARVVGKSLEKLGVMGTASGLKCDLYDNTSGSALVKGDIWDKTPDSRDLYNQLFDRVGAFRLDEANGEVVLLAQLHAGAYSLLVSASTEGEILIETYELPFSE